MEYYFSTCDHTDPVARAYARIRKEEYLLWEDLLPPEDQDTRIALSTLSRSTGKAPSTLRDSLFVGIYTLRRLPRLHALQNQLFHLDRERITAIGNELLIASPEHYPLIDAALTSLLTPTAPAQAMPTTTEIRKRLRRILDELLGFPTAADPGDFSIEHMLNEGTRITAYLPKDLGMWVEKAITNVTSTTGCSPVEAFTGLLRGSITTTVTVNLYQATDIENAPVWSSATADWLPTHREGFWKNQARPTQARRESTRAHNATAALKRYVQGRDGRCRFPGCQARACQLDHRVNWEDGGPTSAGNLASLCQHHHNMKTDGIVRYLLDESTGIIVWILPNGRWQVSAPSGPLSAPGARWARSIAQWRKARREGALAARQTAGYPR
ncbi:MULTISPECIES: HNH endonuclease signature motif containing protein [unclassified Corynebacterium]|uniref:HNH endonuclease signature motif containing protein n=1 Tax=unclassified Corynebacterium TaxID=2624378 RepID=UPI0029C9DE5B|nr:MULTISPECIES: HNH endonuclease signature motif containing protein [unclassified Corynebacterium]WPF67133.1 HNH endonuclease signature motif containing protein [Corynebacterium sp. 22KM0430]WPF69621.1 HNH endonuclease signature motif containing protein [Corynebacterium sp. 21KM1197]